MCDSAPLKNAIQIRIRDLCDRKFFETKQQVVKEKRSVCNRNHMNTIVKFHRQSLNQHQKSLVFSAQNQRSVALRVKLDTHTTRH